MRLFELFDKQYDYTWDEQGTGWYGEFFTKTNDTIDVSIEEMTDGWQIYFTRDLKLEATGAGDAILIFSTVIAMAGEFIQAIKPSIIYFTANKSKDGSSRAKLYDRLVKRFAEKLGYTYAVSNEKAFETKFILTRKEKG